MRITKNDIGGFLKDLYELDDLLTIEAKECRNHLDYMIRTLGLDDIWDDSGVQRGIRELCVEVDKLLRSGDIEVESPAIEAAPPMPPPPPQPPQPQPIPTKGLPDRYHYIEQVARTLSPKGFEKAVLIEDFGSVRKFALHVSDRLKQMERNASVTTVFWVLRLLKVADGIWQGKTIDEVMPKRYYTVFLRALELAPNGFEGNELKAVHGSVNSYAKKVAKDTEVSKSTVDWILRAMRVAEEMEGYLEDSTRL